MEAYLDHNATTRPTPGVVAAVAGALERDWANPSSVHRAGQSARRVVELARASLAGLIGAKPRDLVLCSSGTESIDLAVRGALAASGKRVLVTTAVEHSAVRDLCEALAREQGVEARLAPLGEGGVVDAGALAAMLTPEVGLVSVQWANNETGAVQPVGEIGAACRAAGVAFHCDAVQWVGKMPVDVRGADAPAIDLLSLSPHKFHGPKGVGALWVRPGVGIRPAVHGAQELGRRGGTENVPGIAGAGAAAEEAKAWLEDAVRREQVAALRDRLEAGVLALVPGAVVNGPVEERGSQSRGTRGGMARLWNTTNLGFRGLEAEALLLLLSERGVSASAGAACSSGSLEPSPVLLAMGVEPAVAHGSVRLSLGRGTTPEEVEHAVGAIADAVARLGGIGGLAGGGAKPGMAGRVPGG